MIFYRVILNKIEISYRVILNKIDDNLYIKQDR